MSRITGQQARELLDGTIDGPWSVEVHKRHDIIVSPVGYAVAYNEDEPDVGRPNSELLAAAPALAETVAWLYGAEGQEADNGWRRWPLGRTWSVGLRDGYISIGPEGGGLGFWDLDAAENAARALLSAVEEARRG